ncbi:hypothetical protein PoB_003952600 [Plakobranchus ocellatus]|uniref:Mutator-like transposase domain-containing protein n=1 Tax=Plakobranchus ocellatus TaxID=259542 RepID=A0AAV4B2F8_9GAST|nr:hypothetical protein PoB_003952600 [Plakobranchus ocellatus]
MIQNQTKISNNNIKGVCDSNPYPSFGKDIHVQQCETTVVPEPAVPSEPAPSPEPITDCESALPLSSGPVPPFEHAFEPAPSSELAPGSEPAAFVSAENSSSTLASSAMPHSASEPGPSSQHLAFLLDWITLVTASCLSAGLDHLSHSKFAFLLDWITLVTASCLFAGLDHLSHSKFAFLLDWITLVTASCLFAGVGHSAMKKLSEGLELPGLHHKTYNTHVDTIFEKSNEVMEVILALSKGKVLDFYRQKYPESFQERGTLDLPVSFDESLPKRGHASKLGFDAAIDVHTGLVVNFHIMPLYCQVCLPK